LVAAGDGAAVAEELASWARKGKFKELKDAIAGIILDATDSLSLVSDTIGALPWWPQPPQTANDSKQKPDRNNAALQCLLAEVLPAVDAGPHHVEKVLGLSATFGVLHPKVFAQLITLCGGLISYSKADAVSYAQRLLTLRAFPHAIMFIKDMGLEEDLTPGAVLASVYDVTALVAFAEAFPSYRHLAINKIGCEGSKNTASALKVALIILIMLTTHSPNCHDYYNYPYNTHRSFTSTSCRWLPSLRLCWRLQGSN
jgi:hypothetical protein